MSDKNMWMGTRGHEMWVPAPAVNPDFSSVGWSSKTQYLNGGAGIRSSYASHKEYSMTFSPTSRDRLRPITDMAAGMYGDGLIYWTDPVAADMNALPEHWAFPGQAALDGPVLIGDVRPEAIDTPTNALGYPATSVTYGAGTAKSLYLPIPLGYTAWVGCHGSGGNGVKVTPVGGAASYPAMLAVTDPTRVTDSYPSGTYTGLDLELISGVTLSGLIVQMLPTGVTPASGEFISGQGNSGCRFDGKPSTTPYSVPMDMVGMSAKLTEVGGWI